MLRSIVAVVVPIVMWGVLWGGSNAAMRAAAPEQFDENMVTSNTGLLATAIAISVVLSVVAGLVCVKIAPRLHMRHVWILAIIQFVIGIAVQATVWELMPLWYHIPFLALVMPAHLVGGRLGMGKGD